MNTLSIFLMLLIVFLFIMSTMNIIHRHGRSKCSECQKCSRCQKYSGCLQSTNATAATDVRITANVNYPNINGNGKSNYGLT